MARAAGGFDLKSALNAAKKSLSGPAIYLVVGATSAELGPALARRFMPGRIQTKTHEMVAKIGGVLLATALTGAIVKGRKRLGAMGAVAGGGFSAIAAGYVVPRALQAVSKTVTMAPAVMPATPAPQLRAVGGGVPAGRTRGL